MVVQNHLWTCVTMTLLIKYLFILNLKVLKVKIEKLNHLLMILKIKMFLLIMLFLFLIGHMILMIYLTIWMIIIINMYVGLKSLVYI